MSNYTATNFYNDELSRLHEKQQNTNIILNSQERLAMLNDSYRKRYARYVQILMVLVLSVLLYLGVVLLQKQFPAIPQFAVDGVTIILIFLVVLYIFSVSIELYSRSLLNYDELDIPAYDASGVDVSDLAAKGQIFGSQGAGAGVCVGPQCCPGYYDSGNNVCMSSSITIPPLTTPSLTTSSPTTTPSLTTTYSPTTTPSLTTTSSPTTTPSTTTPSTTTTIQTFTTLEYEKIETAYTDTKFDSPTLKREPNANNVKPLQNLTGLTYSSF